MLCAVCCQKRPTIVSKETYYSVKRDLVCAVCCQYISIQYQYIYQYSIPIYQYPIYISVSNTRAVCCVCMCVCICHTCRCQREDFPGIGPSYLQTNAQGCGTSPRLGLGPRGTHELTYICVRVCVYTYMYICTHTHVHTHTHIHAGSTNSLSFPSLTLIHIFDAADC